jgi:hypothetical protein
MMSSLTVWNDVFIIWNDVIIICNDVIIISAEDELIESRLVKYLLLSMIGSWTFVDM